MQSWKRTLRPRTDDNPIKKEKRNSKGIDTSRIKIKTPSHIAVFKIWRPRYWTDVSKWRTRRAPPKKAWSMVPDRRIRKASSIIPEKPKGPSCSAKTGSLSRRHAQHSSKIALVPAGIVTIGEWLEDWIQACEFYQPVWHARDRTPNVYI